MRTQRRRLATTTVSTSFLLSLALGVAMTTSAGAQSVIDRDTLLTGTQWETFNSELVKAVTNENEGVREGALKQIAYYGDFMDFPELAVFEVMRIYRDHDDPQIKRLSIIALGNMGSPWAIEFLDMLAPYEQDPALKKTMQDVVKASRKSKQT